MGNWVESDMKIITSVALALAAVAFASASGSPVDAVVPEEALVEESAFAEAQAEIESMKKIGKTEADCKKLAKALKGTVNTSVAFAKGLLSKLPSGYKCALSGQSTVYQTRKNLRRAKRKLKGAKSRLGKARKTTINVKPPTFSSIPKRSKCVVSKSNRAYKKVQNKVTHAKNAVTKANNNAKVARKEYNAAKRSAARQRKKCLCETQKLHKAAVAAAKKANSAESRKAYRKATHMLCVLQGTALKKCKKSKFPTVTIRKARSDVRSATCSSNGNRNNNSKPSQRRKKTKKSKRKKTKKSNFIRGRSTGVNGVYCSGGAGRGKLGKYLGYITSKNNRISFLRDPFRAFDKKCKKKYKGSHMCTRAELNNIKTLNQNPGCCYNDGGQNRNYPCCTGLDWRRFAPPHKQSFALAGCGKRKGKVWQFDCRYPGDRTWKPWSKWQVQCDASAGQNIHCCK